MSKRNWIALVMIFFSGWMVSACANLNPQPAGLTPIPTLGAGATPTLISALAPASALVPAVGGEGNAAEGAPIYLLNCSPCHGVEGQGVDAPALRNNDFIETGAVQDIADTIAGGRPSTEMPAWLQANGGPLSNIQINNVIAYLRTLQGVEPLPTPVLETSEAATETPLPPGEPTPEPARPSNPGEPGSATSLAGDADRGRPLFGQNCAACHGPEGVQGVPNPGSDDGSVPVLDPIDPTLVSADPAVFAVNIDLFIEHGSVPEGEDPQILMPSFGDSEMLTEQQIADLIAFVMEINSN
jgi:mono/diheme cytochrome c family protein